MMQGERAQVRDAAALGGERSGEVGERAAVPTTAAAVRTLAGVTLRRLGRGKALRIGVGIAALPLILPGVSRAMHAAGSLPSVFEVVLLLFALLPPMFIAASIGEELDERTCTYLWSRPIARWAVLAGKLGALTPIVIGLVMASWLVAALLGVGELPTLVSCAALIAGAVTSSLVAAGIATLAPKHGMALAIAYLLVDYSLGRLPFSLAKVAVTWQVRTLAGMGGADDGWTAAIAMAVVGGLWAALAVARMGRREA
jgi:hypothetical protein